MGFWGGLKRVGKNLAHVGSLGILDPLTGYGNEGVNAARSAEDVYSGIAVPDVQYEELRGDPNASRYQNQALDSLSQISKTGYDDIDRARQAQINQQQAQAAQANRMAGLEQLQRRGVRGGAQIASTLQGTQAAQNTAANQGLQMAADGATRRLSAIGQLGNQAGQLRSANDSIAQFNIQNKQKVAQQNFDNRFQKAQGVANAKLGVGNAALQRDANSTALLGAGIGAAGQILSSDKSEKTKIADGEKEIEDVFDKVGASTYEYKNRPGQRFASVMAQDLEKSALGKDLVVEDDQGKKYIDSPQATGMLLAAQKIMMEKIKKLEKKGA